MSGWQLRDGSLERDVQCRDFAEALGLVRQVSQSAVDYGRRPDMCISEYNRVRLSITNLHHAGITDAERRLAEKVDALIEALPLD